MGKGLVRSIGLSNFNSRQIDDILSVASIKPTVLQVRGVFVMMKIFILFALGEHHCRIGRKFAVLKASDETGISVFWMDR